jgi:nucleoside-diphosphate-sugar epimerase
MDNTPPRRVLVTGAAGQTGQHIFRKLLARPGYAPIGTVRSEESRQALLAGTAGIGAGEDSTPIPPESVVVCDITNAADTSTLDDLMKDCDALMICTSAKPAPTGEVNEETKRPIFGFPNGQPELVDWIGQKNLMDAAKKSNKDVHVVLCSSMGGTNPNNSLNNLGKIAKPDGSFSGGDILKWKRKAEVYLMNESGLPYTIVHPGGLLNEPGNERELCLGVDDKIPGTSNNSVPREDVANVMIAALEDESYRGRSFDLVSKPVGDGVTTKDYGKLLKSLDGKNCDYSLGEIA